VQVVALINTSDPPVLTSVLIGRLRNRSLWKSGILTAIVVSVWKTGELLVRWFLQNVKRGICSHWKVFWWIMIQFPSPASLMVNFIAEQYSLNYYIEVTLIHFHPVRMCMMAYISLWFMSSLCRCTGTVLNNGKSQVHFISSNVGKTLQLSQANSLQSKGCLVSIV
jgi:hypothetical protein